MSQFEAKYSDDASLSESWSKIEILQRKCVETSEVIYSNDIIPWENATPQINKGFKALCLVPIVSVKGVFNVVK